MGIDRGALVGAVVHGSAGTNAALALVFHHKGNPVADFRKRWAKACAQVGVTGCLFHDLRRSAVRDMVRAGVAQSVAMSITGHQTVSMFLRYNITDGKDQREAFERTAELRRQRIASATTAAPKVVALR